MATSTLGFLSPFLAGKTTSSSLSPYSIRFFHLPQTPANSSTVRAVTSATVSQPSTGKPLRGIMRPRRVSPEMQDLVGVPEISRTQALKQIWAYIKDNNLQVKLVLSSSLTLCSDIKPVVLESWYLFFFPVIFYFSDMGCVFRGNFNLWIRLSFRWQNEFASCAFILSLKLIAGNAALLTCLTRMSILINTAYE